MAGARLHELDASVEIVHVGVDNIIVKDPVDVPQISTLGSNSKSLSPKAAQENQLAEVEELRTCLGSLGRAIGNPVGR